MSARVEQATTWTLHLSNEEFHQLHAAIGQVLDGVLDDLYHAIDEEIDTYRGWGTATARPREVE